jgi:hypothetical protein
MTTQSTKDTEDQVRERLALQAFELIEWAERNVEAARLLWSGAFEEAERIDYTQTVVDDDSVDGSADERVLKARADDRRRRFMRLRDSKQERD